MPLNNSKYTKSIYNKTILTIKEKTKFAVKWWNKQEPRDKLKLARIYCNTHFAMIKDKDVLIIYEKENQSL